MLPNARFAPKCPDAGRRSPLRHEGRRIGRRAVAAFAAAALAGTAPAQIPLPEPAQVNPRPAPGAPQDPERQEHSYQNGYSQSRSHELFRACDTNSDDRLDILETNDAFDVLISAKDHEGFARFDTDRDGFVTWPEFDQRFRKLLEHGGTFRVWTARPFALPEPPPQPLSPLQKFMRLHDKDQDGSLSPSEITDLLKQYGMPPQLAVTLMQSDHDKSNSIDEIEMAPWYQNLGLPVTTTNADEKGGLRQPWLEADSNANKAIDSIELDALLRKLDPALLRWTKQLISKLDLDGNGQLSAAELAPTAAETANVAEDAPAKEPAKATAKPKQSPQR